MEKKYITDTDFLPQELTHYHGLYFDEMRESLYQIVYGIFDVTQTLSGVYEVVVRTASKEKSPAIRKYKLLTWKKSIDAILKALNKVDTKGFEVIVYVPLRDCEMTLSAAQSYFQLAIFTISELLESDSIPEPDYPNEVVPDIKQLFEESYSDFFLALEEEELDENKVDYQRARYLQAVVLDEMYRRGIETIKLNRAKEISDPVQLVNDLVAGKEVKVLEKPILPSEYYDQPNLFKELFIEKGKQLELGGESLTPNASELPSVSDNDNIQTRAAVLYYMLNSFCPLTDENFNRVVAMIDFAVGKQSPKFNVNKANDTEVNKVNNKNSIKKYVRAFRDNPHYLEEPTSDKVRARLSEQGFEVPAFNKSKNP